MSLEDIAIFHIELDKIHPVSDGNGTLGRLLLTYQARKNNYIPHLILNENRKDYLNSLVTVKILLSF